MYICWIDFLLFLPFFLFWFWDLTDLPSPALVLKMAEAQSAAKKWQNEVHTVPGDFSEPGIRSLIPCRHHPPSEQFSSSSSWPGRSFEFLLLETPSWSCSACRVGRGMSLNIKLLEVWWPPCLSTNLYSQFYLIRNQHSELLNFTQQSQSWTLHMEGFIYKHRGRKQENTNSSGAWSDTGFQVLALEPWAMSMF